MDNLIFTQKFTDVPIKEDEYVCNNILSYLDGEEKIELEKMIKSRVRPFIYKMIEKISGDIDSVLTEPIEDYYFKLNKFWDWHIQVNKNADNFILNDINRMNEYWSYDDWNYVELLIKDLFESDYLKTLYSSGIKKKVELEFDSLNRSGIYDENKLQILMGSHVSFYISYYLEHLRYYLKKDGYTEDYLLNKYHCGDSELLDIRMRNFNFLNSEIDTLIKKEEFLTNKSEKSISNTKYFLSELPNDFSIIDSLINFDNYIEYLYVYSFKGFPDIKFRELVLKNINKYGLLLKYDDALRVEKEDFLSSINTIKSEINTRMILPVNTYLQSNGLTCGTACVLMMLEFFKGIYPTIELELEIWSKVGKPKNYTGGMGLILSEYGINSTYVRDSDSLFSDNYHGLSSNNSDLQSSMKLYVNLFKDAIDKGMGFNFIDWDGEYVIDELKKGNPSIVGFGEKYETMCLHWCLAIGYECDNIIVIDPLCGKKKINVSDFNEYINTSMGKRLLVINRTNSNIYKNIN